MWKNAIIEILLIYKAIDIATIATNGKQGKILLQHNLKDANELYLYKLRKFIARGEGIYFKPTKRITHEVLFLDDVPIEMATKLAGTTIVQTSFNKYQAHVKLDESVTESDAKTLQRTLCELTRSDRGCGGDIYHFRRLPGYPNQKYPDKPLVKIIEKTNGLMSVSELRKSIPKQQEIRSVVKFKTKTYNSTLKRWDDFLNSDLSRQDMSYAVYLASRGYSAEAIKNKLLDESTNITLRHKNIERYLSLTVSKAITYFLTYNRKL